MVSVSKVMYTVRNIIKRASIGCATFWHLIDIIFLSDRTLTLKFTSIMEKHNITNYSIFKTE